MLKKLSVAGLAFIASTGITFADTSDSMPASDTSATSDSVTSTTTDTSVSSTTSGNSTAVVHKKHKKKHHHKIHHHRKHCHKSAQTNSAPAPAADPDPVASSAPRADYKGEVPCAPTSCAHNSFMAGPYLGFSVGSRVNYTSLPAVYNGLEGTLLGGYGMLWDQWYGALEIFIQDSAQITNNTNRLGSAKSSWGYGLSILPGYMLVDNVLGYLRLGVVRTRFTTGNSNLTGGQVGLGMQTALCNNWDLRGEYVYSFYNSLSNNGGNPKSQQFNLGLLYKFQM